MAEQRTWQQLATEAVESLEQSNDGWREANEMNRRLIRMHNIELAVASAAAAAAGFVIGLAL